MTLAPSRLVLLESLKDRPAAALVVDGRLEDLAVDPATDAPLPGAIYRAIADRPMKGQGRSPGLPRRAKPIPSPRGCCSNRAMPSSRPARRG